MTLGETIKLLRNELGLTQPDLAAKAGIEQSYLSKLENDKGTPSFDLINRIALALNLNGLGLIQKLSHSYIEENLSHLPEVAAEYASVKQKRETQLTRRLLVAALMLLAGLATYLAGAKALLDSNERFFYESQGLLLPGEHHDQFGDWAIGNIGETHEEYDARMLANRGRIDIEYEASSVNLGPGFIRAFPDGTRRHFQLHESDQVRSKVNLAAEVLGAVCMAAGLLIGGWAAWRARMR